MHDELVADVPAESLVLGGGAPVYEREYSAPAYLKHIEEFHRDVIVEPTDLRSIAMKLISLPNIASKKWVTQQYDSMVGIANTSTNAPSDAAILRIKNSDKALAVTTDCKRAIHSCRSKNRSDDSSGRSGKKYCLLRRNSGLPSPTV